MAELLIEPASGAHRPRNVDWKRAAALLYGDWGTSKAYVLGLAFVAAGFSSLPIILAVCAVTALVGINYAVICRHFPDGGGVYSAARSQGRLLAVVGALLLLADLTVTAALSGWSGLSYITSGAEESFWIRFLRITSGSQPSCMLILMATTELLWTKTQRQSGGDSLRPDCHCCDSAGRHQHSTSLHAISSSRATTISGPSGCSSSA